MPGCSRGSLYERSNKKVVVRPLQALFFIIESGEFWPTWWTTMTRKRQISQTFYDTPGQVFQQFSESRRNSEFNSAVTDGHLFIVDVCSCSVSLSSGFTVSGSEEAVAFSLDILILLILFRHFLTVSDFIFLWSWVYVWVMVDWLKTEHFDSNRVNPKQQA